jgi:hypothetical protein
MMGAMANTFDYSKLALPNFLTATKASLVQSKREVDDARVSTIAQMDSLSMAARQAQYRPVYLTVHRKGVYGTQLRWRSTRLGHLNEKALVKSLRGEPKAIKEWAEQMNELVTRFNCQEKLLRNWSKELERSIVLIERSGSILSGVATPVSSSGTKGITKTKVKT